MNALVENAKKEPGSVFEPETTRALAQLAKTNFSVWINLRAQLKSEARDVPITELDKHVRPNDGGDASGGDDRLLGVPLKYDEIEPCDEHVDGANLLTELSKEIGAYVVMDPPQRDAVALWTVFTHAHDFFVCAPLLIILSPTKRCGKTRLQEVLAKLAPRPPLTDVALAGLLRGYRIRSGSVRLEDGSTAPPRDTICDRFRRPSTAICRLFPALLPLQAATPPQRPENLKKARILQPPQASLVAARQKPETPAILRLVAAWRLNNPGSRE
jgi:hypothetical protein